jgi:hypothetical protein
MRKTSRLIVAFVPILLLTMTFAPADPPPATSRPADDVVAEFKIEHWNDGLLIPIKWHGKPCYFVLDTGAGANALNLSDFPDLKPVGNPIRSETAGGVGTFQMFEPPDVRVGPFSLRDGGPVAGVDLSDFTSSCGRSIIGVIGANALKDLVLQVNFDERKFKLYRHADVPHPLWGAGFDIELVGFKPFVRQTIEGSSQAMLVDTGSDDNIAFPPPGFDHLIAGKKIQVISAPSATANGVVLLRSTRVETISLFSFTFTEALCEEIDNPNCNLGLDFLERHLVTIDFPAKKLYLKPGKEFNHRSEENMSGMHPVRIDGKVIVRFIDPFSPAYDAGIRHDDVLIDVNGKPAKDYDMADLRDALKAGDGQEITVTFAHGKEQKTVKFKLQRTI